MLFLSTLLERVSLLLRKLKYKNQISLWFISRCLTLFSMKLSDSKYFMGPLYLSGSVTSLKAFPVFSNREICPVFWNTGEWAKQGARLSKVQLTRVWILPAAIPAPLTQPSFPSAPSDMVLYILIKICTLICLLGAGDYCRKRLPHCTERLYPLPAEHQGACCSGLERFGNHFSFYLPLKHKTELLSALMCHLLSLALEIHMAEGK